MEGLLSVVLFAVILATGAGEFFDVNQDAIREISARYQDAEVLKTNILRAITNERKNINTSGENELLKYLKDKATEGQQQLEKDSNSVIRTAIVKAKPISVIHCIRNVTSYGLKYIKDLTSTNEGKVLNVRLSKVNKINFDEYAVTSIMLGLEELISQAIEKITQTSGSIDALKKEALNNCDSAALLLGEIEVSVHEPILNREYVKLRQEIDRNFRDQRLLLSKDLDMCLTK